MTNALEKKLLRQEVKKKMTGVVVNLETREREKKVCYFSVPHSGQSLFEDSSRYSMKGNGSLILFLFLYCSSFERNEH